MNPQFFLTSDLFSQSCYTGMVPGVQTPWNRVVHAKGRTIGWQKECLFKRTLSMDLRIYTVKKLSLQAWKLGKHPAPHKFVDRKLPTVINTLKIPKQRKAVGILFDHTAAGVVFDFAKVLLSSHLAGASARVSLQEAIFRLCFRPPPTEAAPALAEQRQWKCLNCGPCSVSRFAKI